MNPAGQILPNSMFGKELTRLARISMNIVETGTFYGLGSTRCVHSGMTHPSQRLYSVDYNDGPHKYAKSIYQTDPRVNLIFGTVVLPNEFSPLNLPDASAEFYAPERDANAKSPYVMDSIPEHIDLLIIDGGGWTANAEFDKLAPRSRIIALDDTNVSKATKNWRNRGTCMSLGYSLVSENQHDRNGWSIFRKSNMFDEIYQNGGWDRKGSGPGSTPGFTEEFRAKLESFLENEKITSVLDYGCGDWSWQSLVKWGRREYVGWDVSFVAVERAREKMDANAGLNAHAFVGDPSFRPSNMDPNGLTIIKDVMHHVDMESRKRIIQWASRFPTVLWVVDMESEKPWGWPTSETPSWEVFHQFNTNIEGYRYGPKTAFIQRN